MKKLCVIVCNNGLGHIKRVLHLLKLFYEKYPGELETAVFVDIGKLVHFPELEKYLKNRFKISFSHIGSSENSSYEKEFLIKNRKELEAADYVWSDNLAFPLKWRDDVFLTSSFLWNDLKSVRSKKPLMIANRYFATPEVMDLTRFKGVGMYQYYPFSLSGKAARGILISCGKSQTGSAFFKKQLSHIRAVLENAPKDIKVYVEPAYFSALKRSGNVIKASFDEGMFSSIGAAVIRPGMGTLSDALVKGARIFSFFEGDNTEVRHNSEVLERLKVGICCRNASGALTRAIQYIDDPISRKAHISNLKKLDFNGLDQTVVHIKKMLD